VGQLTATSVSDQLYVYDVPTAKMGTETYAVKALNQYTSVQKDSQTPISLSYNDNGSLTGDSES